MRRISAMMLFLPLPALSSAQGFRNQWLWPWGYFCENYYSTYSKTASSYGGALGLRYRFRGGTIGKLSYSSWKTDFGSGASIDPQLNAIRLEDARGF